MCIARWEGGERLRLRSGLIIISTTFIVCNQVVKFTVACKNNLYSLLLEIFPAEKDCSHIHYMVREQEFGLETSVLVVGLPPTIRLFLGKAFSTVGPQFSFL